MASTSTRVMPSCSRAARSRCLYTSSAAQAVGRPGLTKAFASDASTSSQGSMASPLLAREDVSVAHLPVLNKASVRADKIGQAFVFDETCTSTIVNNIVDKKARRDLSFTKQPTTVLRAATMEVMEALQKATSSGGTRKVLVGRPGSGRSTILLQVLAWAQSNAWLVLHISNAYKLTDSSYPYQLSEDGHYYHQKEACKAILQQFLQVNKAKLKQLDSALVTAVEGGSKNADEALQALQKLLESSNLPIVLAIDSAEALKGPTKYLDSNARPLPASRLSLPSLLQSYVDGPKKVKHGAVIAAMDKSAPSAAPDTDVSVQVGPLSRTEAAGIFEHLADIKMLHQERPTDADFMEAYVTSDGNAACFTRGLRDVPVATSRGVLKRGKARGVPQREQRTLVLTG